MTCPLARRIPRTYTVENASLAVNGDNQEAYPTHVTDLAIDPITKQVDFSNASPIIPLIENTPQLRERMKQLLGVIMSFFEEEEKQIESGKLKEEDKLLPEPALDYD